MNENEFEFEGRVLVASDSIAFMCSGCVFAELKPNDCINLISVIGVVPRCTAEGRSDGRNVIFVEKLHD